MDEEADLGDEIGAVIEVGDFGIAAQAAKQVIFQRSERLNGMQFIKTSLTGRELVHGVILGRKTEIIS